jgi:hypothetical protein
VRVAGSYGSRWIRTFCVAWLALASATVHAAPDDSAAGPATPVNPERPLPYGAGASLAILYTRTTNPVTIFPRDVMGTGLTLRLQSGLSLLGARRFSVGAFGAFETGLGYQNFDGEYTGHLWFLLRLELGGQAALRVSDDVELALRGGLYAHLNAAREVGNDDDILFGKLIARYQRVALAAGAGQGSHLFFGAQYQFARHYYAGVEYARFPGMDASHELRVCIGTW